jgi:hypothetical protein
MHFAKNLNVNAIHATYMQQLNLNPFRLGMLKRILTILVATLSIVGFGENVADAAAQLITKVIIDPASEPMTMLVVGSGFVLVANYWRKHITKK